MSGSVGGLQAGQVKRVSLFIGPYGSGKSEISVNFALWLRRNDYRVTLCDLDIINPFFRSADTRRVLEEAGIRLVAPVFAGTNVDVPAVPAEAYSVFDDPGRHAVLDIGGEDLGARIVATLKQRLLDIVDDVAVYMVVNPYRPFSQTSSQIVQQAEILTRAAGLAPTALVHNANLLEDSDAGLLTESSVIVKAAAAQLGVPVAFAAAMAEVVPQDWGTRTPDGLPLLKMRRTIHYLR